MSVHTITFTLNGKKVTCTAGRPRSLLARRAARDELGLTGTKIGCSVGVCGAMQHPRADGKLISGCLMPAIFIDGKSVTTIEGLEGPDGKLTKLQEAFITCGGFQCGICTSGQIMAATALLAENPRPNKEEIKSWMMGNLCRCTGYYKIIDSIEEAAGIRNANV